jgi:hypothetical protein
MKITEEAYIFGKSSVVILTKMGFIILGYI